jgi:hypothetical protein
MAEQLAAYRRIHEELTRMIRVEMLLPARLALLPQRK